jgi:hypothetical protein
LCCWTGTWTEGCGDRSAQEPRVEEDRLGLGQFTGGPQDAVLAVQLGGERPAGEQAVKPRVDRHTANSLSRSNPRPTRAWPSTSWTPRNRS